MDRIKVTHIITRFDKGGSAENTFLTVRDLDRTAYDVLLIKGSTAESATGEEERKAADRNLAEADRAGVRILTVPSLVRNIHPLRDVHAFWTLFRILRKERPCIVHTHTSKAGIVGRWAARLSGVPLIVHTPHGHVFWGYFSRRVSRFYVLLERWAAYITDRIIALTEQEKKDHLRFRIAPEEKFDVICSGVDLRRFREDRMNPARTKEDLGIPARAPVVGTVGRLTPVKGHRYLIEAAKHVAAKYPETRFLFLGDGECLGGLRSLAAELGLEDRVLFPGWRPDTADVMSTFDIFVFPSLNEGMGKALVEAMSLGRPVVASRVGGILDLVRDGGNGLLVAPADARAIANGISILMADPEKRRRMGEEGKALALRYGSDRMVRAIDALYQNLLHPESRDGSRPAENPADEAKQP